MSKHQFLPKPALWNLLEMKREAGVEYNLKEREEQHKTHRLLAKPWVCWILNL